MSHSAPLTPKEVVAKMITDMQIISTAEVKAEKMFAKEKQTASALKLILMIFKKISGHTSDEITRKQLWTVDQVGKWFVEDKKDIETNKRIMNAFLSPKVQETHTWLRDKVKQARREFDKEKQTVSALQLIIIYYKECSHGVQENQVWIERQGRKLIQKNPTVESVKLVAVCLPDSRIGLSAKELLKNKKLI